MREQFPLLSELQQLDNRLRALQTEVQALPQRLHAYNAACTEGQQALARLSDDIEQTERQWRAVERELENSQAQFVKTQIKLREVKTNKEYSAVLVEIDTGKQHITAFEDQILDLMEAVERYRQTYQQQEQHVQASVQELAKQEQCVQQEQATLAQQVAVEEEKRQHIITDLETNLYARYQRLSTQRDSQAVVPMQEESCGGCHLKVQPQLVSELRQQDKLITCPHCQRILLWPAQ